MGRTSTAPLQLQEALIGLIWSQCYSNVTIDAICEKAAVKKGSFYYFYKSKTDLAVDAFEHHWNQEIRPQLDQKFSASKTPKERLETFLSDEITFAVEQQEKEGKILGCPFCNVAQEISTLEPELAAAINRHLDRFRSYLSSALRDAIAQNLTNITDPDETALALYNLLHGSFAQARIQNKLTPLQGLPESVSRLTGLQLEISLPVFQS